MKLLEALQWRYATKQMTGEKLPQELVDQILEAARLAPTSAGLQPFHIISISNQELRCELTWAAQFYFASSVQVRMSGSSS